MRMLIVEDDQAIVTPLLEALKPQNVMDIVGTARDGLYQAEINEYDVIVLDLGLPDMDGIDLCRKLRSNGLQTPILILTGRAEISDRVISLDSGADDFLAKPFNISELKARLRALGRRAHRTLSPNLLIKGELQLDLSSGQVYHHQKPITLRRKELLLLEYFMRHAGKIVTREMLFEHVWGGNSEASTNTIDVHIKLLRDKVDKPFNTHYIKTVHGWGYKFDSEPL
ncbi:MAG TPA: response regulator transcription factor [Vitreimonas sp.]|nr:response regulator transcription factor [Vitreimonas sp.]